MSLTGQTGPGGAFIQEKPQPVAQGRVCPKAPEDGSQPGLERAGHAASSRPGRSGFPPGEAQPLAVDFRVEGPISWPVVRITKGAEQSRAQPPLGFNLSLPFWGPLPSWGSLGLSFPSQAGLCGASNQPSSPPGSPCWCKKYKQVAEPGQQRSWRSQAKAPVLVGPAICLGGD